MEGIEPKPRWILPESSIAHNADYVTRTLGYWWQLARDVLASRLRRKAGADTLEATVCL